MTDFSEMKSAAIIAVYDVSQIGTGVDVGGGQGALAAALLRAHAPLGSSQPVPCCRCQRLANSAG